MAARTQLAAWGAASGRRYGSFGGRSGAPHPVGRLTQPRTHGAMAGRTYGGFTRAASSAFDVAFTAPLGVAGGVAVNGNLQWLIAWDVAQPLPVATIGGTLGVAGDIQTLRAHNLAQTSALGLAGTIVATGNLGVVLNLAPSTVSMAGTLGVAGNIGYTEGPPFDVAATAAIALGGQAAIAGALQYANLLDLVQTAPVALDGSAALAGALGTVLDLAWTAPLTVTAQIINVQGDFEAAARFDIAQTGVGLSIAGTVALQPAALQFPSATRGRRGHRRHGGGGGRDNTPHGGRKN